MKLHLGCGRVKLDGWTNIDMKDSADIVHDIRSLDFIPDESVDEIYISHCLEHFSRHELHSIFMEYNRVLKIDGTFRIAVPDLEALFTSGLSIEKLTGLLYGGQTDQYDYHKIGFNFDILKDILECHGFTDVQRYDAWEFLGEDVDDYSKSYIPHMDRNGRLMSLNVVSQKKTSQVELSDRVKVFFGMNKFYTREFFQGTC